MVEMTPWGVFFLPKSLHILKARYFVNSPVVFHGGPGPVGNIMIFVHH